MFVRGRVITDAFITELTKAGAKPVKGIKLGFPTAAPAPWAKLKDGTVVEAVEKGDELVAVVR